MITLNYLPFLRPTLTDLFLIVLETQELSTFFYGMDHSAHN
jgi:hypothetical protein